MLEALRALQGWLVSPKRIICFLEVQHCWYHDQLCCSKPIFKARFKHPCESSRKYGWSLLGFNKTTKTNPWRNLKNGWAGKLQLRHTHNCRDCPPIKWNFVLAIQGVSGLTRQWKLKQELIKYIIILIKPFYALLNWLEISCMPLYSSFNWNQI